MISKLLKRFLAGAAVATVALPGLALADGANGLCVYVLGNVEGQTVTTPAIPIVLPASSLLTQPVRVHLDETTQNILGYSLRLPGLDLGALGLPLFSIPAINETIPSFTVNLPDLNYQRHYCVDVSGATVPAIPYHIPASAILLPGGFADVGGLVFNIAGQEWEVPGKVLRFDGKQIIFPEQTGTTPAIPLNLPDMSVTFTLNASTKVLRYLMPH
ncbi:hypothetical protein [Archangium primigenium]|uniref:hypothetical protein n=1 Tax=[Archangium] primigenium TaxID=2792470 RepID=UPI00195B9FA7|nr:hypothetical protein [Archangium primigenium]MBM7116083.1 hypothetical protein [Archangium primigenium]